MLVSAGYSRFEYGGRVTKPYFKCNGGPVNEAQYPKKTECFDIGTLGA